jgi:UDP:flavonoid glycosyltransferase YjiC (YdhE family)
MANVLFVIAEAGGHFSASLGLAAQLREAGHDVTYVGQERVRAAVEGQGFAFQPVPFLVAPRVTVPPPPGGRRGPRQWLQSFVVRRRHGRAVLAVARDVPAYTDEAVGRLRPDLIVFDPFRLGWYIPFHRHGIPAVAFSSKPLLTADPLVPPYTSGVVPDRSPRGRLRVRLAWLRVRAGYLRHRLGLAAGRVLTGYSPGRLWRTLARQAGYPLRRHWATRPLSFDLRLRGIPELVLFPREFDFPRERPLPPDAVYVGPCVYAGRTEEPFPWDELPAGRSVVLCSLGTMAYNYDRAGVDFLRRVLAAFADDPRRALVLVSGGEPVTRMLGPVPAHVRVCEWAPQLQVLARAEAMITHGGANSIRECMVAGVPVLVYPFRADQPGNAARIVFHGLGIRGDHRRDGPAEIRRKLDALTGDAAIRERVQRMRAAFVRADEERAAAAFVERFLREKGKQNGGAGRASGFAGVGADAREGPHPAA